MGSRERKRAERRKRKQRAGRRPQTRRRIAGEGNASAAPVSRSELKDREAREALEPLRRASDRGAVTVGAVVSA